MRGGKRHGSGRPPGTLNRAAEAHKARIGDLAKDCGEAALGAPVSKARIDAFIRTSKVRELPMTRAITINWERLCGCPDQYEIKQPQLFRRLRLLANRLGFETAYIWVIDVGVNVGVHAHVALYWPSRYLSDLHQVFQALDSTWGCPPNNIHDEAIILERDGDFGWGKYMAEQSNKHPKDIPGRLLGCSTNLFDERH